MLEYLERAPDTSAASVDQIERLLKNKGLRVVTKADLTELAAAEEAEAKRRGVQFFKFSDDEAMLAAIDQEKAKSQVATK